MTAKKVASSRSRSGKSKSPIKDPKGGLTAAGRADFKRKEGAHLKPGVKGPADTPEKMRRKGSFLRRHFANPRGLMTDDAGKPTRLALSAHAWGEPVPKTQAAAHVLAVKGTKLLQRYHDAKASDVAKTTKKTTARQRSAKRNSAKS
ncbi:MAG: DUF6321 domain-containing protein [Pirellulales bacterium]